MSTDTDCKIMKDALICLNNKVRNYSCFSGDHFTIEMCLNQNVIIRVRDCTGRILIPITGVISHDQAIKALRLIEVGMNSVTKFNIS